MKSVCYECLKCKVVPKSEPQMVRCSDNVFREILSIDHPFITLPRRCQNFDPEEENNAEHATE